MHCAVCKIWRSGKIQFFFTTFGLLFQYADNNHRLLATTDHKVAQTMISDERLDLESLANQGANGMAAAKLAVAYLDYLTMTWMLELLWQSWSHKGHSVASVVLSTTNHLESFNGLLKRKYIPCWQHSGSCL